MSVETCFEFAYIYIVFIFSQDAQAISYKICENQSKYFRTMESGGTFSITTNAQDRSGTTRQFLQGQSWYKQHATGLFLLVMRLTSGMPLILSHF